MAKKKSFKSGLTNVIEESLNLLSSDNGADPKEIEELKKKVRNLEEKLALVERELYYWRTGKLTLEKFTESLAKRGLRYDPTTNKIEKV